MKVIIAGSREGITMEDVLQAVEDSKFTITEVVSGGARGTDQLGEQFAAWAGIPVKKFPADWSTHGKAAGPIRNQQMADYADALVAIWDNASSGTAHMIRSAKEKGMPLHVHIVGNPYR